MSQMPSLRFRSPILVIAIAAGVILGWGERPLRAEERTRPRGQDRRDMRPKEGRGPSGRIRLLSSATTTSACTA